MYTLFAASEGFCNSIANMASCEDLQRHEEALEEEIRKLKNQLEGRNNLERLTELSQLVEAAQEQPGTVIEQMKEMGCIFNEDASANQLNV